MEQDVIDYLTTEARRVAVSEIREGFTMHNTVAPENFALEQILSNFTDAAFTKSEYNSLRQTYQTAYVTAFQEESGRSPRR